MTQIISPSKPWTHSKRPHWKLLNGLSFNNRWINVIWLCALIFGLAYQSYLGYEYNSNDTTNHALRIARVAAYNLLILIVLLWLPVMRHATKWLQKTKMGNIWPVQQAKVVHTWLGHSLMLFAAIHACSYLVYFDSLEGSFTPILFGEEADLVR